jgi:hypothetical protein
LDLSLGYELAGILVEGDYAPALLNTAYLGLYRQPVSRLEAIELEALLAIVRV